MQRNACKIEIGAAPVEDGGFTSAEAAVAALATTEQLTRLAKIARNRLDRLASQPHGQRLRGIKDPTELVNQAIELILTGNRKARSQNLSSLKAFVNYVQGVLQSVITHELERIVRQGECVSVDIMEDSPFQPSQLQASYDVVKEAILNENEAAVRAGLEAYADQKAEIDAVLGHMVEPRWIDESDAPRRIKKRIHRLRKRAQKILLQQAAEAGLTSPTPMDAVNL